MYEFVQLIVNGVIAGAVYALVASGFSLVYNVAKFVHLAHGAVLGVAAYLGWWLSTMLGIDFTMSVIITLIAGSLLGWLMNIAVYRPMRKRKASAAILMISSIAILTFFNAGLQAVFGADVKTYAIASINPVFDFAQVRITGSQIVIIAVSIALLLGLWLLMKKTKTGVAMRGLADNKEIAQTVGINPEKTYSITFIIGSFTAAFAGMLIGIEQNLFPYMSVSLMIKGFTGAIIGGIGNVYAGILGSLLLGLVENIGIWWLPSGYKDAIAFALLFLFLIFRPQGILGVKTER